MANQSLPPGFELENAPLPQASAQSGQLPPGYELEEQKYGEGLGNQIGAAAAGLARGATFGLSDQFLTKSGYVKPETLAGLKEYNPVTSGVSELGGAVGSALLAPELSPAGALSEVAGGVSEAAAPLATELAGTVVNPNTSPIINKIVSRAISGGAGGAIEGAAYGLGQAVSDNALGDPDAMGEKLLSRIGMSGFFGGSIGSIFGQFGSELADKAESMGPKEALREQGLAAPAGEGIATPGLSAAIDEAPKEDQISLIEGLKKRKDNADEIDAAAQRLGAPSLEGMTTDSDHIQRLEGTLLKSPTDTGVARQQLYQSGFDKANQAAESTLADRSGLTATELADKTKSDLEDAFQKKYEPIQQGYQDLEPLTKNIEIPPQSRNAISRNIGKIIEDEGLVKGTPERSFVESFADGFGEIDNLDKLKKFRTALGRATGPETRYVSGIIKEKLDNLELNILKRYGEALPEGEPKLIVADVIRQMGETKEAYKAFRGDMETLGKGFWGKKKIYGYKDFIDKLDEIGPSKFGRKLFDKDNVKFADWFQQNFPEQYKNLAQFKKSEIYEHANKSGQFNAPSVFRDIEKLQPETRKALFSPEDLQKLNDSKLYLDNIRKVRNFNPSDSGTHINYLNHFDSLTATGAAALSGHPLIALGAFVSPRAKNLRDQLILKTIKEFGPMGTGKIGALSTLEKIGNGVTGQIKSKADAVFDFAKKVPPGALGSLLAPNPDDHKTRVQTVGEMGNNINKLYSELNQNSAPLYKHAPNVANSAQTVAVRAVQFLNSKLPQEPQKFPLSPDYVPSKGEIAQFNHYFNIVEDPTNIMTEIKSGTLTPQSLETIQTVYPKLYSEMQTQLTEALTKKMTSKSNLLPHQTKLALSLFLGQDLDASTTSQNVLSNQTALANPGQQQALNHIQSQQKISQTGLSKIDKATMIMTPAQKSNQRVES